MKKYITTRHLPAVTLLSGVLGLLLQLFVRLYAIDDKHLLVTEHPSVTLLYILTAGILGIFFLVSRQEKDVGATFPVTTPGLVGVYQTALAVAVQTMRTVSAEPNRFTLIQTVAGIVTVAAFIADDIRRKKGKSFGSLSYGSTSLFILFYTLSQQQSRGLATQPAQIFFPLMACVFLMMGTFYKAYLCVGENALRQYLFFYYGGIFFCMTAIPEDPLFFGLLAVSLLLSPLPKGKPGMFLPKNVRYCLNALKKAGYEAYAVGGCVRDALLGITPNDYDICTSAKPKEIAKVFSRCRLARNGEKHGTIGVILDKNIYEITTFRTEGGYSDSRHPDWVEFVDRLDADLARRDFTVNAMAYSPGAGFVDPFGGRQDLEQRVLRAVGDPNERFTEDALRILRGVRFAARFHLEPEDATYEAMLSLAGNMESLVRERVFAELRGLLPVITAKDLIRYAPVITQVIPELSATVDFQQHSHHHAYDVYTHTAYVVEAVPADPVLRFAALLHDTGKPETFTLDQQGNGHFYGHGAVSAKIADEVLSRLKAPTEFRQQVVTLIEHHMTDILPDKKLLRKRLAQFGEDTLLKLIALQEADFRSKGVAEETDLFTKIRSLLAELQQEASCLSIKDLAIDGNNLMAMGIQPGPQLGDILQSLLEMVLDESLENEKEALLRAAENLRR